MNYTGCIEGFCREPFKNCQEDAQCGAGEQCAAGVCEPTDGTCSSNGDCNAGELCSTQGVCYTPSVTGCTSDAQCGASQRCSNDGACVAIDGGCTKNADCGDGFLCDPTALVCVEDTRHLCTSDAECLGDEVCVDGACQAPTPECVNENDCLGVEICRQGACVLECVNENDCLGTQTCTQNRCVDAVADNPYSGTFTISSTNPIQRCNASTSIQFEARTVNASQSGVSYTFTFPTSTYNGTAQSGQFTVSWSGSQGNNGGTCGELNSANVYQGTFQSNDLWTGTMTSQMFFQLASCNCTLVWPVTGTRQ